MKFGKFLFCIILILSLSALDLNLLNNFNVNASTRFENTLLNLENNTNNYINLSDEDYVQVFKENNQLLYLTKSDIYLMSQVVYAESKGEPYEGKVAVASVILNRALNTGFPNTIQGVVFQPRAFSCVVDGEINVEPTQECFDAVYDALSGNDPTGDAVFFYTQYIVVFILKCDIPLNFILSKIHPKLNFFLNLSLATYHLPLIA